MNRYVAATAALIAGVFSIHQANAQLAVAKVVATCGTVSPTPAAGTTYPITIDITGTLCTVGGGGGGGGTSSNFGTTFPGSGTAAGAEYLTVAPTLTSGQMVAFQTDINGNLKVNVAAGAGGGTASSFGAAFPATGTAAGFEYLTSPPTLTTGQMVAGQTDVNGNLKVAVVSGGAANASVSATGSAVPGSATYAGINIGGTLTGLVGTANGLTVAQATAANLNATVSPVLAATWGLLAQNATTSGQLGQLMMGAVTTAAPTYTNAQTSSLSLDTGGNLRVNVVTGGGGPPANQTVTSCAGSITTGGTAQNAIAAQTTLHQFTITNNDPTHGGGEPLWISLTTTAVQSGGTGSDPLAPPAATTLAGMGSITIANGTNHAVSIIAATTGHTFGCFWS